MAGVSKTTAVAAQVPADVAKRLQEIADGHERSVAAELRLAIRSHIEAHDKRAAEAVGA